MKTKSRALIGCVTVASLLAACASAPYYSNDFRIPIGEGDIARGEQTFVDKGCTQCHTIRDYKLPPYTGAMPYNVELGGVILYAKSYSELATSIINPDYRLSERYLKQLSKPDRKRVTNSPMHVDNAQISIAELLDLVAFFDSRYASVPGYYQYYNWD